MSLEGQTQMIRTDFKANDTGSSEKWLQVLSFGLIVLMYSDSRKEV